VSAELIFYNAKIATNGVPSFVEAIAITAGRIAAAGKDDEILRLRGPQTLVIDGRRRTIIPGLNDSHMHPIRGGLNYNLELRWDGVPSLADALRMLNEQAARTPAPQWVRVIGGWTEFQFAERRMPTLDEINAVAPDTPVFVMHLYNRALLNGAALRAVGYDKDAPDFPAGEVQRDRHGNPTGLLIAKPNANILYSTLAKGPKLSRPDQINSSRLFFRELNRFGITSAIDAGGGFQNYPDDYGVVNELHRNGELSIRLAYNLFTQKPRQELSDFQSWTNMTKPGNGDDLYRVNGAGEILAFSAADFEDFLVPRPDMLPVVESELKAVIRHLVENRWPFRLHATYNETIERPLNVYEEVYREIPFDGLHWFFDHCETISDRNIERVKALGGGIAVQNRMAFQGEYFVERFGTQQAKRTPPISTYAADWCPGRRRHRRDPRFQLQPLPFPLLAYHRQNHRGTRSLPAREPPGSRGSTQALHDGEQLVFHGRWKKGSSRSWPVSRLGCSLCRLLFHSRGGDQASRIGTHDRRWEDRLRHQRILKPCAASAASEPKLVADQRVRRRRECLKRSAGSVTF
jgi:predicted amidohydrolase YtcJ